MASSLCIAFLDTAAAQSLTVTTIAGQFKNETSINGNGINALFTSPAAIRADPFGNFYVIDIDCIRKIDASLNVTTFAGIPYFAGYIDATSTNALFTDPFNLAVDKNGYVYVADWGNDVVRKITPAGVVTTLAGNGTNGYVDAKGTNAEFGSLDGIAVDASGTVYVTDVTPYGLYYPDLIMIRKITPDGTVSTLVAGTEGYNDGVGSSAQFNDPQGLAVDAAGIVYVADSFGVRKVAPDGTVTTWAGSQLNDESELDGLGTNAGFYQASDIALDRSGGAYVTDEDGGTVRYISHDGAVSTVAGMAGVFATNTIGGVGTNVLFTAPHSVTVDASGNVYIADAYGDVILEGTPPPLAPFGSFSESPGSAPIFSNNPWQFTAYYTNIVSDLRLRVQSSVTTNDEGSWTDLPESPNMTDSDGNWNLNALFVPAGQQYFRAVASAPGYVDAASAATGPENVVTGIGLFGTFTWQTPPPYRSGAAWTFSIVETSVLSGLALRIQSTLDGTNWNDLPGGQMSTSNSVNWTLTTISVPVGTVSFRVVASASTYPDELSAPVGPFTIVAGLPDTYIFDESPGAVPVRSSNPWQFLAYETNLIANVPGLQLRVQSTTTPNDASSWQDLPDDPYMTYYGPNWELNCTDVPTGDQYFRAVSSAPGYVDGGSSIQGPETVLPGFDHWGLFSYETTIPYTTQTPWSFAIVQSSAIVGMTLHMQSTATTNDDTSWTDLPGGGQMTRFADGKTWLLYTTELPIGTGYFRVVASAPDYADLVSAVLGPFDISPPLPVQSDNVSQGGTYSVEDFSGFVNGLNNVIHAIGAEVHLIFSGNSPTTQGDITLSGDQTGSVDLTVANGQVLTSAGVNVGKNAHLFVSGTANGDVNNGLISQDGAALISQDGAALISQDGAALGPPKDNSSLVALDSASLQAIVDASLKQNTDAPVLSVNGSAVLSANGSAVLSVNGSAVVNAPAMIIPGSKSFPTSRSPSKPKPALPDPTQPSFTGVMTINGNYNQFSGALIIGIAGTNTTSTGAQQYDQLAVSGTANFTGGRIAFGLFDPDDQTDQVDVYQPQDGDIFDVVVASNILTQNLTVRGPIWGDGQFFQWAVVTRLDGLQALRLQATHISPPLGILNGDSGPQLIYPTNFVDYYVQSSDEPTFTNWNYYSSGTNVVPISPTGTHLFFRLSDQ